MVSATFTECIDYGNEIDPMLSAYVPHVLDWIKEQGGEDVDFCIPKNYPI